MAAVNGSANGNAPAAADSYDARPPRLSKRGPKIIIIGAGVNAMIAAVWLKNYAHFDNFTILERNENFAGTWWSNKYPGLSCDIPATLYQFPFEPNPNWSSPYPLRDELLEYCLAVAEKYGLYPYAQFNTEVRSMTWDDKAKEWTLALRRYASEHSAEYTEDSMKANIVIDVHKPINEPGFPYFPGAGWSADNPYYLRNKEVQPVSPFEGKVMHSMVYDLDYDITGKRVAVIGCSAAAIQIVPTIAPKCGHLYVYHRTPDWVVPRDDAPFSEEQKKRWRENPLEYALYRGKYNREFFQLWWGAMWRDGSEWSEKTKKMALENMHEHIKDPKLREILTPDFPPWSRRLLVSSKFYPALMRDNVTLCQERILEVTKNAVVSSSEDPRTAAVLPGRPIPPPDPNAEKIVREVDVIIYATGWAQGIDAMKRGFTIFGRGGKTLGQHFFEMGEPKNYMGQMFDGFPNYFTLAGAGALPADTFQRAGEIGMGWFLQLLDRVRNENLASFEVTPEAVKQWDDMVANLSQGMAMLTPGVKSYYKVPRADGTHKLFGFFPSTDDEMAVIFRKPFWEHLILTPRKEAW